MSLRPIVLPVLILIAWLPPSEAIWADEAAGESLFALEGRPILASKCFACHSADADEIQGGST